MLNTFSALNQKEICFLLLVPVSPCMVTIHVKILLRNVNSYWAAAFNPCHLLTNRGQYQSLKYIYSSMHLCLFIKFQSFVWSTCTSCYLWYGLKVCNLQTFYWFINMLYSMCYLPLIGCLNSISEVNLLILQLRVICICVF